MTGLPPAAPVGECAGPLDAARFAEIRAAGKPIVLRGLVDHWPGVNAARQGDEQLIAYLTREASLRPVRAIVAPPCENGRFFYNAEVNRLNFHAGNGPLEIFLADLLHAKQVADPPAMAVQSEPVSEVLPHFARENRLDLLPQVPARIWIGNRIRVAPHFDMKENIACCLAGRRRFTLFPPDMLAQLYPGPFELTPAGTPVSMVDLANPDLATYPRFAEAWANASQATLEPGDALYIPYCWWHGVDALEAVSILVNYWWTDALPAGVGQPYDALLHALLSYRHLPPGQREVWRRMLDYYVFGKDGDPGAHLPLAARGVLGPASPGLFRQMREIIRQALG